MPIDAHRLAPSMEMDVVRRGLLVSEKVEVVTGQLQVKEVFRISRLGLIAFCLVADGKIQGSNHARVIRDKHTIHTGKIAKLVRLGEDICEVAEGCECGVKIAGFEDIRVGDTIQSFAIQECQKIIGSTTVDPGDSAPQD